MQVCIQTLVPSGQEIEIVEHKGIGHPDTMCDALAEELGVSLARFYMDRFGAVLHYNVDKGLLWGGSARAAFGGGEVHEPMELFLAGRATREAQGVKVPVEELAVEGTRAWLRKHLHALDAERHVKIHCLVRPGSTDLVDLFALGSQTPLSNDTSCGAGYAPLSVLEQTVLAVARHLRAASADPKTAAVGEDVKIMGVRKGDLIELTVACAFIGRFIGNIARYVEISGELASSVRQVASEASGREVVVRLNAADDVHASRVYLTVTGTSAEAGDDGEVGRGNRANGLITPYRPMTMEATAGKNPVSHVGKLYNLAAHAIAADITRALPEVASALCYLVSDIGRPIDDPRVVDVRVTPRFGATREELAPRIDAIVRDGLSHLGRIRDRLLRGEVQVF